MVQPASDTGALLMLTLVYDGAGFDLSANAAAPLAPWARALQRAAHYEEFGRGPRGYDCLGIVGAALAAMGRVMRDYRDAYAGVDIAAHDAVDEIIRAEAAAWQDGAGDVGDVLVLGSGRRAHHVAVLCGAGHALHARAIAGIKIEPIGGRKHVTRFAGMRLYGVGRPN